MEIRNRNRTRQVAYALLVLAALAAAVAWIEPEWAAERADSATNSIAGDAYPTDFAGRFDYKSMKQVLARHCLSCHGGKLQMKNVRLDAARYVKAYAPYIYQQVVVNERMPLGNGTGMTDAERQLVRRWFDAGAPTE